MKKFQFYHWLDTDRIEFIVDFSVEDDFVWFFSFADNEFEMLKMVTFEVPNYFEL